MPVLLLAHFCAMRGLALKGRLSMKLAKYMAAVAALSLAAAPAVAAPANPAASLSVAKSVRAGTAAKGKDKLAGGGIVVAVIAAVAVVAGVIIVASDDNSDSN